MSESRICIPLTSDQQKRIKIKAAETGLSMAEVARRFLLAWLRGELELPGDNSND